jgi:hypothetical protein
VLEGYAKELGLLIRHFGRVKITIPAVRAMRARIVYRVHRLDLTVG